MTRVLIAVALMAAVTYIPRVLPIAVLRSKLKSTFVRSFLYYVPYAVLGAMIFPGVLFSTGYMQSAVIGMLAAFVLAYFEMGLMVVAIAAIFAVFLCELVMKSF